jgi:tRNA threonylcarbamoyladenosine biosynthesis protein TsaE
MPTTKSELETYKLAEKIAQKIKNGGIVFLIGELGTGKTVFTKGIAHVLGINRFSIKSPTYTYIRKYKSKNMKNFYHIDLYRLDQIDDLLLQEIVELTENKKNIIIIEWADKLKDYLQTKKTKVFFEYIDPSKRKITLR